MSSAYRQRYEKANICSEKAAGRQDWTSVRQFAIVYKQMFDERKFEVKL
ncbi:hypothetical protein HMPREF0972_02218 [Actinomyces sp. oral taxon 848 str. F0332]|nr:hypothetical protein HMPREF0972_02218 [Actinomyces sp. oral taxon 848 str. F0332]